MAITVNNATNQEDTTNFLYTPTTIADAVLAALVSEEASGTDVMPTLTWRGVSMTRVAYANPGGGGFENPTAIYIAIDPGTTSGLVGLSSDNDASVTMVTLGGVDQTTPIVGNTSEGAGEVDTDVPTNSDNTTVAVTSTVNGSLALSIGTMNEAGTCDDPPINATVLFNVSTDSACHCAVFELKASAGTITHSFDWDSSKARLSSTMAVFQPAAAPPSGRIMSSLAGAGGLAYSGGIAGRGGGLAG